MNAAEIQALVGIAGLVLAVAVRAGIAIERRRTRPVSVTYDDYAWTFAVDDEIAPREWSGYGVRLVVDGETLGYYRGGNVAARRVREWRP